MYQDGAWNGGGPWSRPRCARSGPSSPPPKRGGALQFSVHLYCRQTAGCIKMPLCMEVGLSPVNFVLDGDPALLSQKVRSPSIFCPCLLWPNGCMYQDAIWYGGRSRPTRHCVRPGPCSPHLKGHSTPNFRTMFPVAKRLDGLRWHLVWR